MKVLFTFVDDRSDVPPDDEETDEEEVEDDGESNYDPGEYLPGVPVSSLINWFIRNLLIILSRVFVDVIIVIIIIVDTHLELSQVSMFTQFTFSENKSKDN